jgi:hypothetical protein
VVGGQQEAWLTDNDVLLVRDVIPAGLFLNFVDQVTGQDVLPNFRVERFGPQGPEPERAPAQDRPRGPITQPEPKPKPRPPPLPPPTVAEPESVGVGKAATELEPDVEEIGDNVIFVDLTEGEAEPEEEIPNVTLGSTTLGALTDRPRGLDQASPVDDNWSLEAVKLVVLAAHPDRTLLITSAQDPYISFVPPVPVYVIWNWVKDQSFQPSSTMPFLGDDTCKDSRPAIDAALAALSSQSQREQPTVPPGDEEVDPLSDYRGLIIFSQAHRHRPAAFAADTQRDTLQLSMCFLNLGNLSRPSRYPTRQVRSRDATRSILLRLWRENSSHIIMGCEASELLNPEVREQLEAIGLVLGFSEDTSLVVAARGPSAKARHGILPRPDRPTQQKSSACVKSLAAPINPSPGENPPRLYVPGQPAIAAASSSSSSRDLPFGPAPMPPKIRPTSPYGPAPTPPMVRPAAPMPPKIRPEEPVWYPQGMQPPSRPHTETEESTSTQFMEPPEEPEEPPSRLIPGLQLEEVPIPYRDLPMNFWEWPIHDQHWTRGYWVPTVNAWLCQGINEEPITVLTNHYFACRGAALMTYYWQQDHGRQFRSLNDVASVVATVMGRWDRNRIRSQMRAAMIQMRFRRFHNLYESMDFTPYLRWSEHLDKMG